MMGMGTDHIEDDRADPSYGSSNTGMNAGNTAKGRSTAGIILSDDKIKLPKRMKVARFNRFKIQLV